MGAVFGRLLSRTVKVVASASDRLRPARSGLVILLYHRVGAGTGSSVDLEPALFAAHLDRLIQHCEALALDDALQALSGTAGERRQIAVTFDDGAADFVDHALPLLEDRGVPVILYLATEHTESGRPFPDGLRPASWAALRDALTTGTLTVGSHTHTHRLLDRADPREAVVELDRSRALIEDRLGVPARHFAYPKARAGSPAADAAVRARFASAALAGTRPNRYGHTDPYRLARSPVQQTDGLRFFDKKMSGGMALEDDLRRLLDRRRYASHTT